MHSELERPSQARVLLRIPDLGAAPAGTRAAKPAIKAGPRPELPKSLIEARPLKPEFTAAPPYPKPSPPPGRWRSPLSLIAAMAIIAAALFAISNRNRDQPPVPPKTPGQSAVTAPLTHNASATSLEAGPDADVWPPTETATEGAEQVGHSGSGAAEAWIQRLPPVVPQSSAFGDLQLSIPDNAANGSFEHDSAASGMCGYGYRPSVARLENRIDTSVPEANDDTPRQSLY